MAPGFNTRNSKDAAGNVQFPEANLINDERYNYNRALISEYPH